LKQILLLRRPNLFRIAEVSNEPPRRVSESSVIRRIASIVTSDLSVTAAKDRVALGPGRNIVPLPVKRPFRDSADILADNAVSWEIGHTLMKLEIVKGIRREAETEMARNAVDHLRMPWVIIAFGAKDLQIGQSCIGHRILATMASEMKSKLLCQINDLF
jgi:hypothetical protein